MFLFAWIFCWYHISLPACYNLNPFKTMKKKTNSNTHCFQIICRLCVPFCHFLRKSFPCLFILTLVSTFFFFGLEKSWYARLFYHWLGSTASAKNALSFQPLNFIYIRTHLTCISSSLKGKMYWKKYGNYFVTLWLKKGIHLLGVIFIFFFIF